MAPELPTEANPPGLAPVVDQSSRAERELVAAILRKDPSLPLGEGIGSMNPCRVCHARVLAERVDHALIFWPHCPYAGFHRSGE
jgi:hypothetical protein